MTQTLEEATYPTNLTAEVMAALRKPIPQEKLLTVDKGSKRGTFRYAQVDYLEQRLREVDPDWQQPDYLVTAASTGTGVAGVVVCKLTVLGVTRSATAGYLIPAITQVYDRETRQYKEHQTTSEETHTITSKAEAASFRRVCAKFELGAELWPDKTQPIADEQESHTNGHTPAQPNYLSNRSASGGQVSTGGTQATSGGATQGQVSWLTKDIARGGFGFKLAVAQGLSKSEASSVIDQLKAVQQDDKYEHNPTPFIRKALNVTAPHLLAVLDRDDEDDDED